MKGRIEMPISEPTAVFSIRDDRDMEIKQAVLQVYRALEEKGYNPINQLVGYILSEDPTYITTYKNARRAPEVVAVTPLDRIVVETDAPYMSPVPNRGRRNDSRNLPYIVEKLAEWKGISPEEMAAHTWNNGLRLFGLEGKV